MLSDGWEVAVLADGGGGCQEGGATEPPGVTAGPRTSGVSP